MTTIEKIAFGSLVVSILGLVFAIAIHIHNDIMTREEVKKIKRRIGMENGNHDF